MSQGKTSYWWVPKKLRQRNLKNALAVALIFPAVGSCIMVVVLVVDETQMKEYVIAKCPYCQYYWNPRRTPVEDVKESVGNAIARLKVCPRCTIRFDRAGAKKPKVWDEQHKSYKAFAGQLDTYNGIPSTANQ